MRLRGHTIDYEGASSDVHHRIRYFAKMLAGGRLGQNSTFRQAEEARCVMIDLAADLEHRGVLAVQN